MPDPAAFSADALAASLAPPVLEVSGYRYHGRVLSIEEWLPFYARLGEIERAARVDGARDATTVRAELTLAREYLRAVFPRWRLRPFWAPDPVRLLRRAPGNALVEAFARFFGHQARLMMRPTLPSPSMPGTPSASAPRPSAESSGAAVPMPVPG
jgi:hypothetical protein